MWIRQSIPNMLTLGNLACGVAAIIWALDIPNIGTNAPYIGWAVAMAMLCDFLDGFVARALKAASPIGKELNSLADMVTFGVLPGILVFVMLKQQNGDVSEEDWSQKLLPYLGLVIPLFSALRLAKFNVDTRQSDRFLGLATPANALFFLSLFLTYEIDRLSPFTHDRAWMWSYMEYLTQTPALIAFALVFSILLVSEIPLIAFKFKGFGLGKNWPKYLLLVICITLLVLTGYRAGPAVLAAYFIISFIDAQRKDT